MVFALPLVTRCTRQARSPWTNVNSHRHVHDRVGLRPARVRGVDHVFAEDLSPSLRKMGVFAAFTFVAGAAQIALRRCSAAANVERFPHIPEIIRGGAEVLFYVVAGRVPCSPTCAGRLGAVRPAVGGECRARAAFWFGGLGALRAAACCSRWQMVRRAAVPVPIPQALAYVLGRWHSWRLVVTFGLVHQACACPKPPSSGFHRGASGEGQAGDADSCLRGRKRARGGGASVELHPVEIPVGRGRIAEAAAKGRPRCCFVSKLAGLQGHPPVRARDGVRAGSTRPMSTGWRLIPENAAAEIHSFDTCRCGAARSWTRSTCS